MTIEIGRNRSVTLELCDMLRLAHNKDHPANPVLYITAHNNKECTIVEMLTNYKHHRHIMQPDCSCAGAGKRTRIGGCAGRVQGVQLVQQQVPNANLRERGKRQYK